MRLYSYLHNAQAGYGVVADDHVIDIGSVLADIEGVGLPRNQVARETMPSA